MPCKNEADDEPCFSEDDESLSAEASDDGDAGAFREKSAVDADGAADGAPDGVAGVQQEAASEASEDSAHRWA